MSENLYQGWVTLTVVHDGVYTTTKEYKKWSSYFDLVKDLGRNVVEFRVSVQEYGYKL